MFPSSMFFVMALSFWIGTPVPVQAANRLEELILWKVSDELRLSPAEEKSFNQIWHDLNEKKATLSKELEFASQDLGKAADEKSRAAAFRRLQKTQAALGQLPVQELERLKPVLGLQRLGRYLEVKQDLANKVKTLLSEKSEKKAKDLPPPRILEEDKPKPAN